MTRNEMLPGILLLVLIVMSNIASGAELRLRAECHPTTAIVTLGHVAEIATVDPAERESLAAIELFPSPVAGTEQFIRIREIQDLLLIRGLHLPSHRFSGAAQVRVFIPREKTPHVAAKPSPRKAPVPRRTSQAQFRRAEEQIRRAILRYLAERTSTKTSWSIDFRTTEQQARLLGNVHEELNVRGGREPWTGTQRFELSTSGTETPTLFSLEVEVSLPPALVVMARSLARGTRIGPGDVRLQHRANRLAPDDSFSTLEEVFGMETTRSVLAGGILARNAVREPILVRRGEVITICARAAGVRIETQVRAKDDGGKGDLINVETLDRQARFLAQVSGVQKAEVYARSTPTDTTPITRQVNTPIRQVNTPTQQVNTPTRQVNTPTRQVNTPTQQVVTLNRQVNISTKQDTVPTRMAARVQTTADGWIPRPK